MYEASIPLLLRAFDSLSAILAKGEEYAKANGIDPAELIQTRLVADMAPLASQVQRASDTAKGCAARLTGVTPPAMEDNEVTFADLKARIDKTVAFLKSVTPAQFDGSDTRTVELKLGAEPTRFDGKTYLLGFVLPNFYFHVTTAYDILRHKGVPVGKKDFLGLR
jgi:hypothetical protein